jgi:FO synthase
MTEAGRIIALTLCPTEALLAEARARRDSRGTVRLTWSRKVFIPLTRLCADVCHYCTFATTPSQVAAPYLTPDEVLRIAREGAAAGCKEALFTLGDAPERRYAAARVWLAERGFARTIDYVRHCAEAVLAETGLLPHVNAGVLDEDDWRALKPVAASCGLMLESTAARLGDKGGPHHGSPDKEPTVRLESLAAAGRAKMPMTSGILVGIGESEAERINALVAIDALHRAHGHIQEVIVQNFQPKPGTQMAKAPAPADDEFLRAVALARIVLDDSISVQVPPNLNGARLERLIEAGLDDWGGISPVTRDHVNPEAPWPEIERLARICAAAGRPLVERLTAHPRYVAGQGWIDPKLLPRRAIVGGRRVSPISHRAHRPHRLGTSMSVRLRSNCIACSTARPTVTSWASAKLSNCSRRAVALRTRWSRWPTRCAPRCRAIR